MPKRILSLSPKAQVRLHQLHELIHDNTFTGSATDRFFECGFTAESLQRLRAQFNCANDADLLAKVKEFDLSRLFLFVNDTRQQIIAAESSQFHLRPSGSVWDVLSGTQSFVKGVIATHCGKRGRQDAADNVAADPHEVDLIFVSGLLLKDMHSKDGFEYATSEHKDAYVNQQLIDRLKNAFAKVIDECSEGEKRAIVIPGIGAGAFAGNRETVARVKAQLDGAIQSILASLPEEQANKIAAVVFDSYQGHEGEAKTINGIPYKASSTKANLAAIPDSVDKIITEAGGDPQAFSDQVVRVSKIVAWDMLSCEGNEGRPNKEGSYSGSTYSTDDPLTVRDTNVLDCIKNVNQPFSAGNPQVEVPQKPNQEDIDTYPLSAKERARHVAWVAYQKAALAKIEAMQAIEETLNREQDEADRLFNEADVAWQSAKKAVETLKGEERTAYLKTVIPCVLVPLVAATAVLTGVGFGANIAVQFFPALSTGLSGVVSGVLLGCAIALVAGVIAGSVLRAKYAKQEAAAKGKVTSAEQEKNSFFQAQNAPMNKYQNAKVGPEEVFQKAHGKFVQAVDAIAKGESPAASSDQHIGAASKEGELESKQDPTAPFLNK